MKPEKKTVYFIIEPWVFKGPHRFELVAVEARVTDKTVRLERCKASGFRQQLNVGECHFSVESAVRAKEEELEALESKAKQLRRSLAAMELPGEESKG